MPETIHVLVVRHPDEPTEFTVEHADEARVNVISIDLGSSFDGRVPDSRRGVEWLASEMAALNGVPTTGRVYGTAVAWLRSAASDVTGSDDLIGRCVQIHRDGGDVPEGVEGFLWEPGGARDGVQDDE